MWLDELPGPLTARPPRVVRVLRGFGLFVIAVVVAGALFNDPRPGFTRDGLWVTVGLIALLGGLAIVLPRRRLARGRRLAGMLVLTAGSCLLSGMQPRGGGVVGIYVVVIVAALRLPGLTAALVCAIAVAAETAVLALTAGQFAGAEVGFLSSVIPWYFTMTLIRQLAESRAAQLEAAALAERGRVARDMHDVLAHTLSALALQLEATRLLARDRGADPEVVDAVGQAHRLAADGLDEARRAIGALRGDELPGPERLRELAAASPEDCDVTVTGEPRPLAADVALAVYRTAQEALTNVRRHSDARHVDLRLAYGPDDVTLVVQDDGAPVANGNGAGYGLTGMRERAELLGGRLDAGPNDHGFRVRLWLPA